MIRCKPHERGCERADPAITPPHPPNRRSLPLPSFLMIRCRVRRPLSYQDTSTAPTGAPVPPREGHPSIEDWCACSTCRAIDERGVALGRCIPTPTSRAAT